MFEDIKEIYISEIERMKAKVTEACREAFEDNLKSCDDFPSKRVAEGKSGIPKKKGKIEKDKNQGKGKERGERDNEESESDSESIGLSSSESGDELEEIKRKEESGQDESESDESDQSFKKPKKKENKISEKKSEKPAKNKQNPKKKGINPEKKQQTSEKNSKSTQNLKKDTQKPENNLISDQIENTSLPEKSCNSPVFFTLLPTPENTRLLLNKLSSSEQKINSILETLSNMLVQDSDVKSSNLFKDPQLIATLEEFSNREFSNSLKSQYEKVKKIIKTQIQENRKKNKGSN